MYHVYMHLSKLKRLDSIQVSNGRSAKMCWTVWLISFEVGWKESIKLKKKTLKHEGFSLLVSEITVQ